MRKNRDGSFTDTPRFTIDPSDTVQAMLRERAEARPDDIVVEERTEVGAWRPVRARELADRVEDVARGLIGVGVRPGESVAVLSATSFEWMLLDLGILSVGAVTVPIYESDSAAQIGHILADAEVSHVFTATSQQAELVESVRTPGVRAIDSLDRGALRTLSSAARSVAPSEVDDRSAAVRAEDVATIIYTSGTTGVPKGVVLTHSNFVGTTRAVYQILPEVIDAPDTRLLLFLPLAHVLARFVMHAVLGGHGTIAFSPDVKRLLPDIQAFRPSALLAVPRVLEKVYNAASSKAGHGLRRRIFAWSAKQARAASAARETAFGPSPALRLRHGMAERLVLGKVRAALGPNIRYVVSGGAPLATDLAQFFAGTGITLLQGYGLSETTGPITVQRPGANPKGAVGQVLPGDSVRVAEDGEVLVRGISVMRGYHDLPEETAKALSGGWFHTGDLGTLDRKGQLRITGRKKELIVTAGGKNVSPEVLEDALQTHPLISHVVVVGDGRPYIGALITLDAEMLPGWLRAHGLDTVDPATAADLPEVRESLQRAIDRANHQVSRAESIRRFRILDAAFTVENGYLTPSLKLRRSQVLHDFAGDVDALYDEGEAEKVAQENAEAEGRRRRRGRRS
ncbi:AMP-dependent synthetase/ligase [Actinomyces sp.]|uniref:AMP-dependent synthetase/ligase n=1 Tax=Actinomyces sp. TaxID=29317 RepID=UPI00289D577F|nr:AMP-dependent synthetase/ligase [Actinomyces sp.]